MAVLNANTVSDGGTNVTARVWVNFNGVVNQVGVRGSYNVTSVSRSGNGDYTLTYSITLPDTNYCVQMTGSGTEGGSNAFDIGIYGTQAAQAANQTFLTTTTVRMLQQNSGGTNVDSNSIHVAVFR